MHAAPGPMTAPPRSEANIRDYLNVLIRRKAVFIQVFVMVMTVGVVVTAMAKPVYITYAKLLVPTATSSINMIDAANPIGSMLAQANPDSVATQLQVLESEPFLEDARQTAKINRSPDVIQPTVRVEALNGTNVIQITTEGGSPKDIARLTNTIIDMHLERTDLSSNNNLRSTLAFARKSKSEANRRLSKAEAALLSFRKAHKVVELTAKQEADAREYLDLQAKIREAESNIRLTKAQIAELNARIRKEPLDVVEETRRDNPRVAKIQDRLDQLTLDREDILRRYKPTSRQVLELDAQLQAAQAKLQAEPKELVERKHSPNQVRVGLNSRLAELEAALQGHEADLNAVKSQYDTRKGVVDNIGPWEVEQNRLLRERDMAQEEYTRLARQLGDLEMREKVNVNTARVIERAAVPRSPIRPRKSTNLILTVVIALALAGGMAFLQEYLDDRVNSPDDLDRMLGLPALAHVPAMPLEQAPIVSALPMNSQVVEAYRSLRTSVGFAAIDHPMRRILVTSSSKGEGKSVTSLNLATAMALDGKKVILIDADLRRPSIHRLLKQENTPGLSEVLAGMKPLETVLRETDLPNLSVICSGSIPPNPAELVGSRAFDQLMERLEEMADVIILDSPPCIPVTDPLILASRVDGVLLVLHVGHTKKAAIRHAQDLLERAHARIIGVVYNQVERKQGGYAYYQQYYAYGGDGYYADSAQRGDHHRNGRNGKRNGRGGGKELGGEEVLSLQSWARSDDEDREG